MADCIDEQLEKIAKNIEFCYSKGAINELFFGKFEKSFDKLVCDTTEIVGREMNGIILNDAIISPNARSYSTDVAIQLILESIGVKKAILNANRTMLEKEIYKLKSEFYFRMARISLEKEDEERKNVA